MEAFCAAIVGRGVRGSELVVNTMLAAPSSDGGGGEFTVVGDKDFEVCTRLVFNSTMPGLQGRCGIGLSF